MYITSVNGTLNDVISYRGASNGWISRFDGSRMLIFAFSGGAQITATTAFTTNTWNHVAMCRSANTVNIYLNGTLAGTGASTGGLDGTTSDTLIIGVNADLGSYAITGYINDLRISKGIARYTSTFTPPTTAFITK